VLTLAEGYRSEETVQMMLPAERRMPETLEPAVAVGTGQLDPVLLSNGDSLVSIDVSSFLKPTG
jgi:hypothetical protein